LISIERDDPNLIKVQVMDTVLYLRGLNSQGDDNLRAGGLAFGPMHLPWLEELNRRQIPALAISGFGAGTVADQVARAREIITALPEWGESGREFHLLGHSTGGLIARALAHELPSPERVRSVVTLAAPHRGSKLTAVARTFSQRHPRLHKLFCLVNYDINQRMRSFADLSPAEAARFNEKYPDRQGVKYASVVFSLPVHDMSWPIRLTNRIFNEDAVLTDHDGYVERVSQEWGEVLAHIPLDHLCQIGFDFSLNRRRRRHGRAQFARVGDILEEFWRGL
jgi:triacylglycerol lipase